MLVRDRIDLLVDRSPRSWSCRRWPPGDVYGNDVPGAGVVTGIASSRACPA